MLCLCHSIQFFHFVQWFLTNINLFLNFSLLGQRYNDKSISTLMNESQVCLKIVQSCPDGLNELEKFLPDSVSNLFLDNKEFMNSEVFSVSHGNLTLSIIRIHYKGKTLPTLQGGADLNMHINRYMLYCLPAYHLTLLPLQSSCGPGVQKCNPLLQWQWWNFIRTWNLFQFLFSYQV